MIINSLRCFKKLKKIILIILSLILLTIVGCTEDDIAINDNNQSDPVVADVCDDFIYTVK